MLYPDFNDLIAFGDRKCNLAHPSRRLVKSAVLGGYRSPFRGQGLEFDSVREYVAGDDIRNIDWRVTARAGSPHLKLFKEERERQIFICVDMNATMRFGTKNTFKSVQAARVAALLGWEGLAKQNRVSFCFFGDVAGGIQLITPKRTRASFCSVLKTFTEPPLEKNHISLEKALRHVSQSVHSGALVYLISDFMEINKDFQQEASFSWLSKKCDLVLIGINDQADRSIHPIGRVGFQSSSLNKIYVNTESLAGRKAYADLWTEHEEKLQEISSRLKIPVVELTTQSDVAKDLILALKKMSRRKK